MNQRVALSNDVTFFYVSDNYVRRDSRRLNSSNDMQLTNELPVRGALTSGALSEGDLVNYPYTPAHIDR